MLTGLQSGFATQHQLNPSSSSSSLLSSCPPYWMLFSSPRQSLDVCEPSPWQRSHSLNSSILRTTFTVSPSGDEEGTTQKASPTVTASPGGQRPSANCERGQRKAQKAFVPDLLNPPACLSSLPHQRRKNLRQCSLSVLDTPTQPDPDTETHPRSASAHTASNTRIPPSRTSSASMVRGYEPCVCVLLKLLLQNEIHSTADDAASQGQTLNSHSFTLCLLSYFLAVHSRGHVSWQCGQASVV